MKNVIIIHGTGGSPEGNWFPWMKAELEALGCRVLVPRFPTPEGQSFDAWRDVFVNVIEGINKTNTILVGHSMGAGFIMRMVEETDTPYQAIVAVSPFNALLGDSFFDARNVSFVNHPYDTGRLRAGAGRKLCFAGDNDPYVPLRCAQEVAELLGVELCLIQGGGHLNAEFGYLAFPELLAEVESLLK